MVLVVKKEGVVQVRDILFKNLTSQDHHSRDIFMSECFSLQGVTTKTEKHFVYNIRDHAIINNSQELENWVKKYAQRGPHLKDLSVLKTYDSKTGEEKYEVKIEGNLYVLCEHDIYNVDFTQIFKVDRQG
ncbi:MAG: hypothetical protein JW714_02695, partial [Candidatus Omnitrophica bacterium]|nr:hypothetical protein [Candidatus Omnitrophota bacterium]